MNTIIALMIVTSQGATEVAQFNTVEECQQAKAQIKQQDSFCYQRAPVDMDQVFDHMDKLFERMKKSLDRVKEEDANTRT